MNAREHRSVNLPRLDHAAPSDHGRPRSLGSSARSGSRESGGWRAAWSGRIRCLLTTCLIWLASAADVWAQVSEEKEEKTFVPSYVIIIFAVGLALLVICRMGKRTTSFRRE